MATFAELGIDTKGRTSGQLKCLCPQCSHRRKKKHEPCLSVDLDAGLWHCFNPDCGWAGSLNGGDDDAYGSIPRTPAAPLPLPFIRPIETPRGDTLDPAARDFLARRGIAPDVWERNRIGFVNGAITYPYYRAGELVNIKHRGRGKKFWLEAGAELILYGTDDIAAGEALVWVEGEMDKLAVEVAGVTACVSPPNGAPALNAKNYARHFAYLETQADTLATVSRHIIAVDNDAAGRGLQEELVRRLGPERCWLVTWPAGCKDANEVLTQHGAAIVARCIGQARACPIAGVYEVADLRAAVLDMYDRGVTPGVTPGSARLAEHYRPCPGEITIVTGVPSHGKSTVVDWLIADIARAHGWQFAVCSPENQPLERHIARLATLWTGLPFAEGPHERMSRDTLGHALDALQEHFMFLLPATDYSADNIVALARTAVYRRGIKGLVIDPWNHIDHSRKNGQREDEHINEVLTKLHQFARASKVHIWVIAHPRTLIKTVSKDGKSAYPVPTLYDISGGSQFFNHADMGISVWRDVTDPSAPTQVHVLKVRWEQNGKPGLVQLWFDGVSRRFSDHGPIAHRPEDPARAPWPDAVER